MLWREESLLRERGSAKVVRPVLLAGTVAGWLLLGRAPGVAQNSSQFWGELNEHIEQSPRVGFLLLAKTERDVGSGRDIKLGANLDITMKPILRSKRSVTEDYWERNHYLVAQVGYQYILTVGDGPPSHENRGILELTARFELPRDFWMVNRARVDLRDVNGAYSTRYRYRLGVEHDKQLFGLETTPYASVEVFYDTRYHTVSRERYQAGIDAVLSKHWRIEPYLMRQNNRRPQPSHVNALGLKLKHY
jgi:hypothetical protein